MTSHAERPARQQSKPVRPVLVGVSDDHQGAAAVRAAAHLAQQSHSPLRLVHVWREVEWFYSAPAAAFHGLIAARQREEGMLNEAAIEARRIARDVPVSAEFVAGSVFDVLRKRSHGARALVLGGARHPEPDSIVAWMIKNARCPVMVVDSGGRVVAGSPDLADAQL